MYTIKQNKLRNFHIFGAKTKNHKVKLCINLHKILLQQLMKYYLYLLIIYTKKV